MVMLRKYLSGLILFMVWQGNGLAQEGHGLGFSMSSPGGVTQWDVYYERAAKMPDEGILQRVFWGVSMGSRILGQDSTGHALGRNSILVFVCNENQRGFLYRGGVGYEGGDGTQWGFISNRLGFSTLMPAYGMGKSGKMGFGVEWKVDFSPHKNRDAKDAGEVFPYLDSALYF